MNTPTLNVEPVEPTFVDLSEFTSYEEDERTIICDRKNPNAWIRSDLVSSIEP